MPHRRSRRRPRPPRPDTHDERVDKRIGIGRCRATPANRSGERALPPQAAQRWRGRGPASRSALSRDCQVRRRGRVRGTPARPTAQSERDATQVDHTSIPTDADFAHFRTRGTRRKVSTDHLRQNVEPWRRGDSARSAPLSHRTCGRRRKERRLCVQQRSQPGVSERAAEPARHAGRRSRPRAAQTCPPRPNPPWSGRPAIVSAKLGECFVATSGSPAVPEGRRPADRHWRRTSRPALAAVVGIAARGG
jgi:hypothetical protein